MKIISGAQTGADQAGLDVAHKLGLITGGFITKDWKTSEGKLDKTYVDKMHLTSIATTSYEDRTYKNVEESDGTIRLCVNHNTLGEKCTFKAITKYHKPYIDVDLLNPINPNIVKQWIADNKIETLNIAGNTQWTEKFDIYKMTYDYLMEVLK